MMHRLELETKQQQQSNQWDEEYNWMLYSVYNQVTITATAHVITCSVVHMAMKKPPKAPT